MSPPKRLRPRSGGLVLAATNLLLGALLSPTWLFGKYPNLARGLARGELTGAQVGDASPAYLLLNLLLSPQALRWLQWLLAGFAVVLIFELLYRRAGPSAAWVGGALLAFSQSWLVYQSVLEPDLLIGVLLLGAVAASCLAPRSTAVLWVALALGLATSLRPTSAVFAAFLLGRLLLQRAPLRELAPAVALALASAIVPSALLHVKAGHDVRGTMSAGQVFHQSHRPESVGFGAVFPSLLKVVETQAAAGPHPPDQAHELYRGLARAAEPSRTSDAAAEWYWVERSVAFLRREPLTALRQELQKIVFFLVPPLGEYDIPAIQPLLDRWSGVPLRWLTLLGTGAALLLLLRTPRPLPTTPWLLQWLAALLAGLAFYSHGRYMVGLVPALAGLGGLAASSLAHGRMTARMQVGRGLVLILPALLLLLPEVRWADRMVERITEFDTRSRRPRPDERASWDAAWAGYIEEQAALPDVFWPNSPRGAGVLADDAQTASRAAELAVARYGVASPVDATLAAGLLAQAGRCTEALELTNRAESSGFHWSSGDSVIDPHVVASDCLVSLGRRVEAVAKLEEAERRAPGRLEVLSRLVAAGDTGTATDVERWETALFDLHDAASAHYALARARRRWGDPAGALADADWLVIHWPTARAFAEAERALALSNLGRDLDAVDAWQRTIELRAPFHGSSQLDPLVRSLTEANGDASVASLAMAHWRMRGMRNHVRELLAAHPELRSRP